MRWAKTKLMTDLVTVETRLMTGHVSVDAKTKVMTHHVKMDTKLMADHSRWTRTNLTTDHIGMKTWGWTQGPE